MNHTAERWARICGIFARAADRPTGERDRAVAELCAGDEELRREVLELLAADERAGELLERPAALALGPLPSQVGRRIGPYRLVRETGRGGMGVVYEAERADGAYEQRVALKLIRRGMDSEAIVRRFRRERQILARLEHPHIARLLDGGITPEGEPFFVMELVQGEPIDEYCTGRRLPIRERLRLFRSVCEAMSYAHRNLVVHRDLKPSNVMVAAGGVVKLLDFGVARLLDDADDREATQTETRHHPLTPAYASPEQLLGEPVTTSSDVYSLGLLLYELLAGRHPHPDPSASAQELLRSLECVPAPPSAAVREETARSAGEVSAARLSSKLSGELDSIVLKAIRREPERRYASVDQLSEDVVRYLDSRPVLARKGTAGYRAWKFARRHRVGMAAACIVALSLLGGVGATAWQAERAREEARRATEQARIADTERFKAQRVRDFLQRMLLAANPSWNRARQAGGPEVTVRQILDEAASQAGSELAELPEIEAEIRRTLAMSYRVLGLYPQAAQQGELALALDRRLHGEAHPSTAAALSELGAIRYLSGDLAGALEATRRSVDAFRAAGVETDTFFVATLNNLGLFYRMRGMLPEAEGSLREANELARRHLGDAHPVVAISYANLALVHSDRGDLAAAERYYRLQAEVFHRLRPREYFEEAIALNNVARIRVLRGDYAEAERLLDRALAVFARTAGPDHHNAAYPHVTRALLRHRTGEQAAAEQEVLRALEILAPLVPPDHPDAAAAETVYGMVLTATRRAAEAERRLRPALEVHRKAYGADHWRTADAAGALGLALAAQGRRAEAEPLLVESHAALLAALGEQDPRTAEAALRLARFHDAAISPGSPRPRPSTPTPKPLR